MLIFIIKENIMDINESEFKRIVEESYTYADICRKIGWKPQGGNYKVVKKYIKELNLDTSHFTGYATNICNRLNRDKEKNVEDYLTTNSYIKADRLKWKLFSTGLKKYRCEKCGRTHWEGEQISLQLHHINGDNTDNRLENLQILCPNCHSQTDNYCGANKASINNSKRYCRCCGKEIEKTQTGLCNECYEMLVKSDEGIKLLHSKYGYTGLCEVCGCEVKDKRNKICDKCARERKRKVERPSKEELANLIKDRTFTSIANEYGVSRTSISKWCKYYDLPYRKKDIENL